MKLGKVVFFIYVLIGIYQFGVSQSCGILTPTTLIPGTSPSNDVLKDYIHKLRDCGNQHQEAYSNHKLHKIPINVIVISSNKSYGYFEYLVSKIYKSFEYANYAFRDAKMQFYVLNDIKEHNTYKDYHSRTTMTDYMNIEFVKENYIHGVINLIIPDEAYSGREVVTGVTTFPTDNFFLKYNDAIICTRWGFGENFTLAHELGHYFGLRHTHNDNPIIPTLNELIMRKEGKYFSPSGAEVYCYSNCEDAGDFLCSTPATPNANNPKLYSGHCTFSLAELESYFKTTFFSVPNRYHGLGDAGVNFLSGNLPDNRNIMSYNNSQTMTAIPPPSQIPPLSEEEFYRQHKFGSYDDCTGYFSPEQINVIHACLHNSRAYLREVFTDDDVDLSYEISGPTMIRTKKKFTINNPVLQPDKIINKLWGGREMKSSDNFLDIEAIGGIDMRPARLDLPDYDEIKKEYPYNVYPSKIRSFMDKVRVKDIETDVAFVYVLRSEGFGTDSIRNSTYIVKPAEGPNLVSNEVPAVQNYFSPNGDGSNDNFSIRKLAEMDKAYEKAQLSIYNRWGNTVWRSIEEYKEDWSGHTQDGETLPDGVYYYRIESLLEPGKVKTGFVEVMRE